MINKFLLGALLFLVPCSADAKNYRPYISISFAKIITAKDVKPDDETELCDGSGWITHGDGHKTECPGCSACQDKPKPKPDITKTCKCNTRSTYCNCVKTYGRCRCGPGKTAQSAVELAFAPPASAR